MIFTDLLAPSFLSRKRPQHLPTERNNFSSQHPIEAHLRGHKTTNMHAGKYTGLEILLSNFTFDNLNCYISFNKT